mmetsp:Transcript_1801/g.3708  ORF Transcript_1801/g.3708 Transcript_1801/m.3708 type:complete len:150 (+) Transcript_1801:741-1190(+)
MVIISFIFAGFYINVDSLRPGLALLPYASFMRWAFQALSINQFKGMEFDCSDASDTACLATGEEVLAFSSFDTYTLAEVVLIQVCIMCGFLLLGVLILTQNRLSFMPLGFVGPSYSQDLEDAPDNTSAAAALCVGVEKQGLGLGQGEQA